MGVTSFRGVENIGDSTYYQRLKDNVSLYIDWAFLEAGAFFNIQIPTSGAFGGNRHVLHRVDDPRYTTGRVWEGYRKNWIWESGLTQAASQPIAISGIFINTTFLPINSGYYIDYPNGRVVFDTPMPANSSVKVAYSHKWISIVSADGLDIFEIQHRSFRADDSNLSSGSGIWNKFSDSRLQLPAIAITSPVMRDSTGFQLGNAKVISSDVVLHVLAEDVGTATKIAGILSNQKEQTLFMFDSQRLAEENKLPLDYKGKPITNAMTYPMLIEPSGLGGYRAEDIQYGQFYIEDVDNQDCKAINKNTHHNPVTWTIEAILTKI